MNHFFEHFTKGRLTLHASQHGFAEVDGRAEFDI